MDHEYISNMPKVNCGALFPTDDEVADLIRRIPCHFSTTYVSVGPSNTGTLTASFPAGGAVPSVTPVLTALSISQSGGSLGPNGIVKVWDGPIGSGTLIWQAYLSGPGAAVMSAPGVVTGGLGGSVGIIQDMPLPKAPNGNLQCLQALQGNQLNIQVTGTSNNNVVMNCRFSDGLPTGP